MENSQGSEKKKMANHHLRILHVNYKEWGYAKNWITIQWVINLGD